MNRAGILVAAVVVLVALPWAAAGQEATRPTFSKDVAPILFEHCVSCHRPGEVAPMSLTSYEAVRPWARAVRTKVVSREMPPWHADPAFGSFKNNTSLTHEEIDIISRWVDAGSPRGNEADLPEFPAFAEGWQGDEGPPDYVLVMPEFAAPADGEIPYMNFYVHNTLPEDKFIRAIEMRPSNRRVTHHGRIDSVILPDTCHVDEKGALLENGTGLPCPDDPTTGGTFDAPEETGERFHLIAYVPGRSYERYAPGVGKRLKSGLWLRFNMHYQATGTPEVDATRLGLWFHKSPVTHEVFTQSVGQSLPTAVVPVRHSLVDGIEYVSEETGTNDEVPTIPPFVDNWKIVAVTPVTEPITVYHMWPHMHLRGKDMKWVVTYPDGRDETILSVPNFNFNWQLQYELAEPLHLPAGSKVTAVGHYDNSLKNRWNPAPDKEVYWAEQSWDEMFIPYIGYTVDSLDLNNPKKSTDD